MLSTLHNLADIRLGHPFRGSVKASDKGNAFVVQVRDTEATGEILSNCLLTTDLTSNKSPNWLKQGDVLFVAKGARHYASIVEDLPENTVCSPHFFLIRMKSIRQKDVLPAFICWQLNQVPAQRYFKSSAEGSLQVSIRRQVLENVPIVIPPLEHQLKLVALHRSAVKEQKTMQKLIVNRQQQLDAIASDLFKNIKRNSIEE